MFFGVVALLAAILVELAISHAKIEEIGVKSSVNRVVEEWGVFERTFDQLFLLVDPRNVAKSFRVHLRRLHSQLQKPSRIESPILERFRSQLNSAVNSVLPAIEVFALRVLSLISVFPIIVLCCLVIGLDGWVRREVRKAGAGIESARIYHAAKRSIRPICLWACLIYLAAPITLDVRWVYGVLAVVIPVLVGVTISRFKKYV